MNNEQIETTPEVKAQDSLEDNGNRLSAARRFAMEQYEKLRRVTSTQVAQVRQYTNEAREQLHQKWDSTCTKARDVHKTGEEFVKSNPTSSIIGALGVGIIIGLILGNRR